MLYLPIIFDILATTTEMNGITWRLYHSSVEICFNKSQEALDLAYDVISMTSEAHCVLLPI